MNRDLAAHSLFKPKPSKGESKAEITDHAARAIIDDEAARREAKTAKLRQARMEYEKQLAATPIPTKTTTRKPTKQRLSQLS